MNKKWKEVKSRSYESSIGGMYFEKSKCSDKKGVQKSAVETDMEDVMRHQSHKDMWASHILTGSEDERRLMSGNSAKVKPSGDVL